MYNRYVPQNDGTYQRSWVPEPGSSQPKPQPPSGRPPARRPPAPPGATPGCPPPDPPPPPDECFSPDNAAGFLRRLLPKDMDTGDLLVLLILLLLLNDGSEDSPSMLLTIALFFLMK